MQRESVRQPFFSVQVLPSMHRSLSPSISILIRNSPIWKSLTLVALFVAMMSWTGCNRQDLSFSGPIELAERDSIVTLLEAVSQDAMRSAFENLDNYSYRRYLRTEQFDIEDFLLAFTEHIVDAGFADTIRTTSVARADSGGAFEFGFFNRFVSENVDDPDPVDLVPFLIEDEPSFLNPKNIDKYSFRMAGDTLMWDRSALIIEVRAKPDLADGLNIRRVRHYIDTSTNELVAMHLERIDLGLLFREESTFYVHVLPVPSGEMLPYNTRFQTMIRTPFKGSYRIRTVSTYTDYQRQRGG